jgi:hypothetical protein
VGGLVRLNEHLSGVVAASRAPRDLAEKLERAFGRTEVGDEERRVRVDDSDQRDVRDVEPLRDDLSSDEDVDVPRLQIGVDRFGGAACTQGFTVHAPNPLAREKAHRRFRDLFGPGSVVTDVGRGAVGHFAGGSERASQ